MAASIRSFVLAPFYFFLLTVFAIRPGHPRNPDRLMALLLLPGHARSAVSLRLSLFRLSFRDRWLLRKPNRSFIRISRLRKWFLSPWTRTIPQCWRFTRREMERTAQSGAGAAISIFCNGLVDSYRFANGTFHRDWFDRERRENAAFHLPAELHQFGCATLIHRLNPQLPLSQYLYDKREFERICREHGFPSVPIYATFEQGRVEYQISVPEEPLFSKPARLSGGRGEFARWWPANDRSTGAPLFRADNGESMTLQGLFEHLKTQSRSEACLLQRLITNHDAIGDMCGVKTLCTLRLPTCCFPDGEVKVLPLANFKVPANKDDLVDNMASGGVAYVVDTEGGRLEAGGGHATNEVYRCIPTTGKRAVGFELPYWRDTVELCKTAHSQAFSTYPTVGWDVAITPHGPLLVEMNVHWERPTGLPGEAFTGETDYVDCVQAHLKRLWPGQTVP